MEILYFFSAILLSIFGIRLSTALRNRDYMNAEIQENEKQEYQNSRNHSITLAAFTIGAIALITSRDDLTNINFQYGLAFLSVAMFSFFIGSYMFIFQNKRNWFPYIGETLEFIGIVSLSIGFFYIVLQLFPESPLLPVLYGLFFIGLVAVASYELYLNKRAFNNGRGRRK